LKKKLLFILIPLLIIAGTALGAFYYVNKNIYIPSPKDFIFDSKDKEEQAQFEEEKGMTNILLIGVDGRENDQDARTDSMILATIDANNKRIKLTSFMRDMYVPIPGHGQNRINTAYFLGGAELLLKTINQDFNLNVQYYMSIDFRAFQDVVDTLGGIEVEIKESELDQINYYIKEANWNNPKYIDGAGYQHLNGQQALSYSRIRKVGNGDYERTERQRKVISLLVDKARETSLVKIPQLFSAVVPYVKTNMPTTKLMNLGFTAYKFGNTPVESIRIPADGMFEDMRIQGASVLVPNLEKNIILLEKFMYSSGGSLATNLPVYMENNFHASDAPIDKRGVKRNVVKIVIPEEATESDGLDEEDAIEIDIDTEQGSIGEDVIVIPGESESQEDEDSASEVDNPSSDNESNSKTEGNNNSETGNTTTNPPKNNQGQQSGQGQSNIATP
jgi:polyisoprenyl-teichoic acid--peptidoglycan teichoic acid transferase